MSEMTTTTDHAGTLTHAIRANTTTIHEAIEGQLPETSAATAIVALNDIDVRATTLARALAVERVRSARLAAWARAERARWNVMNDVYQDEASRTAAVLAATAHANAMRYACEYHGDLDAPAEDGRVSS